MSGVAFTREEAQRLLNRLAKLPFAPRWHSDGDLQKWINEVTVFLKQAARYADSEEAGYSERPPE